MSQKPQRDDPLAAERTEHAASATRIATAPSGPVRTKGTSLAGLIGYVRKDYGEEGIARFASALGSREVARLLSEMVLRGSWYPLEDYHVLLEVAEATFVDRPRFSFRHGMFGADTDLRGVYRAFVRLASPRFLIERAGHVWRQYHTTGELTITGTSDRGVTYELAGFAVPHALHCEATLGWSVRAAELTGVTEVRGYHPLCRARGASQCVSRLEWR